MPSFAVSLQSGSSGNAIYVEARGVRLLFDAGISGRRTEQRLAQCSIEAKRIHALIVSHEHTDHVTGVRVLQRRFGLPVHATRGTIAALDAGSRLLDRGDAHVFRAGQTIRFGPVSVETCAIPHDAADPVCFIVDDGRRRLGILTDIGHVSAELGEVVASLDSVFLESNHDRDMLESGPYPPKLKSRIAGPRGHLSNEESASLLRDHGRRIRWAVLSHLSEHNNTPRIALATHRRIGHAHIAIATASREARGPVLVFGA